ncbi:carbohydrate-binding protein [Nesterenkonia alkaliphila]|nr:carbohydrate-binding protein [Nesterenkonia alkaliphila]
MPAPLRGFTALALASFLAFTGFAPAAHADVEPTVEPTLSTAEDQAEDLAEESERPEEQGVETSLTMDVSPTELAPGDQYQVEGEFTAEGVDITGTEVGFVVGEELDENGNVVGETLFNYPFEINSGWYRFWSHAPEAWASHDTTYIQAVYEETQAEGVTVPATYSPAVGITVVEQDPEPQTFHVTTWARTATGDRVLRGLDHRVTAQIRPRDDFDFSLADVEVLDGTLEFISGNAINSGDVLSTLDIADAVADGSAEIVNGILYVDHWVSTAQMPLTSTNRPVWVRLVEGSSTQLAQAPNVAPSNGTLRVSDPAIIASNAGAAEGDDATITVSLDIPEDYPHRPVGGQIGVYASTSSAAEQISVSDVDDETFTAEVTIPAERLSPGTNGVFQLRHINSERFAETTRNVSVHVFTEVQASTPTPEIQLGEGETHATDVEIEAVMEFEPGSWPAGSWSPRGDFYLYSSEGGEPLEDLGITGYTETDHSATMAIDELPVGEHEFMVLYHDNHTGTVNQNGTGYQGWSNPVTVTVTESEQDPVEVSLQMPFYTAEHAELRGLDNEVEVTINLPEDAVLPEDLDGTIEVYTVTPGTPAIGSAEITSLDEPITVTISTESFRTDRVSENIRARLVDSTTLTAEPSGLRLLYVFDPAVTVTPEEQNIYDDADFATVTAELAIPDRYDYQERYPEGIPADYPHDLSGTIEVRELRSASGGELFASASLDTETRSAELEIPVADLELGENTLWARLVDAPSFGENYITRENPFTITVEEAPEPEPEHPAWDSATVYTGGEIVEYQGRVFEALWWTRNQEPGASPYSAWSEIGAPTECESGTYPAWAASTEFRGGETVVHEGTIYTAKWYSRNQEPGDQWGPWEDGGNC